MATAREESANGAGGKFKKRPFRRSTQATPYDRPPTALRNPTANVNINNNNNGWLSKLVDPAHRLIVSSAHRLFASVFRKRLTPPPPPAPPEPGVQGAIGSRDDLNNSSDNGGLSEVEQILKQKTFSRSEIDRLTALLQSRTAEIPVRYEQKSHEAIPSNSMVLHNRKEAPLDTPVKENGIGNQVISTPVVSSTVHDEDIASPADLAKAYMGSRPSKVSPSMLGVRGQAFREESTVLSNQLFPSASPVMSLVPRSSGRAAVPENGFMTPRSRGRSAIYNMARAPYSRVHSATTSKGSGLTTDSVAGPSSSQSTLEKNRLTGSKQGSLKRRSSVLDTDIGSAGPIRRIRQKPNLLSSRTLNSPAFGSPLSVRGSGVADAFQHASSSLQNPALSRETNHGLTKMLTENGDNSIPSTSSTPIPSKSSEMASKILLQLDKLVSSREKSPAKLSSSMLRGPALKSLENVDSSIFVENVQDENRLHGSLDDPLPEVRGSSSQKGDKVHENGPTKTSSPKLIPATDGVDAAGSIKNNLCSTKTIDFAITNSTAHPHPQKKSAFQMSAHEDYLELDDDDSNGPPSMPSADGNGRDKPTSSLDNKTTVSESITVDKSPAQSDIRENNDEAVAAGKGPVFAFSTMPSPSMTAQPAEIATLSTLTSDKAANKSSSSPIFSFGEKFASPKESNAVSPTFSTGVTNVDKVPQFTSGSSLSVISDPPTLKFGAPLNSKPESSTSLASAAVAAADSVTKVPESDTPDNGVRTSEIPLAASVSPSTSSIFSFGAPSNSSTLNNGSLASCPSLTSSPTQTLFSSSGFNQNLCSSSTVSFPTTNNGASSITTSSATASTAAAPVFLFGSSPFPSTSISPMAATSGIESTEGKKNDTSSGNSTSLLFGSSSAFAGTGSSTSTATSLAATGAGTSIFGGTLTTFSTTVSSTFGGTSSATTSTGSSIFAGASPPIMSTSVSSFGGTCSTVANTGSSIFGFGAGAPTSAATSQGLASSPFGACNAQASVNATSVVATTQSIPTQFGSIASSSSFGLATNPSFSSSSSIFGSSTSVAAPFGSVPSFGLSSSASSSEANSISSSSGTTTNVFGSSWQSPKTPVFVSAFNSTSPSTVFSFGASASSTTSSSAPVFGSSTNASSSSMFPFTSAATATSSQPAFGNSNTVFPFSSAPSNNNDQMSMEDTMAEDTVITSTPAFPATPAVPAFGQQPIPPSSSFVFGSTPSTGANTFQFGSQQNPTSQNTSPFQPSGSLDFNAGGSFSLGTSGGDKSQRRMVKVRKQRKK
ncbi:hypothetical protein WN944_018910 [Citrus x changshan-huyou]|uniref:Nuclear pore complex protein n=1 Tax=Citrus x changshan-huyou TaxID=2935761 RepID=A0AAP0LUY9_9ROSI